MSMLDSFFNKGFKGTKCKTMLKLTIPRIKLLRNRKELQIKQMRKDIAKLLETGQEATARIRVEHIVREENMMAAQEIIELYCELIAVRLPIVESQRECPLDLKEAISSICFAAPRCADLPELLQVQLAFVSKYGREFVAAATELMPNCGVNRQLIELLSVRAPSPEKKFKLLKEIAEEHDLDWDPAPSETELFKSHEDLLNGPSQFIGGVKQPLPEENDEILKSSTVHDADEPSYSVEGFDELDFPEVPNVPLRPAVGSEVVPPQASAPDQEPCLASGSPVEKEVDSFNQSIISPRSTFQADRHEPLESSANPGVTKQFVPFMSALTLSSVSPPARESTSLSSVSPPVRESIQSSNLARTRSDPNVDLNDVLAAAKDAAESAERAAAAARSAANLAEIRISELSKNKSDQSLDEDTENPFHGSSSNISSTMENLQLDDEALPAPWSAAEHFENNQSVYKSEDANDGETDLETPSPAEKSFTQEFPYPQPQRIPSMDDEYFAHPNLFNSQSGSVVSDSHASDDSKLRQGKEDSN